MTLGSRHVDAQQLGVARPTASGQTVTVYSLAWPNPASNVTAEVQVCAGASQPAPYTFAFPSYFQVKFEDGTGIAAYGSRKQPTFERTPLTAPHQCVRGWLDYATSTNQRPVMLRYHEAGADGKPIEWPIK